MYNLTSILAHYSHFRGRANHTNPKNGEARNNRGILIQAHGFLEDAKLPPNRGASLIFVAGQEPGVLMKETQHPRCVV